MSQGEGVLDRRMDFCDSLSAYDTDELYTTCDGCDQFHCLCCCHDPADDTVCHHYPVVFTDGACSKNGFDGAVSGIGGTYGNDVDYQWSIPVDERIDSTPIRTNQRAELLAAIEGVRRLGEFLESKPEENPRLNPRSVMVVATDSEYVCRGMTEWMPKWKKNGWRTSSGKFVSNKDLFCTLDDAVSALESRKLDVKFWWIERQFNGRADALAKAAC